MIYFGAIILILAVVALVGYPLIRQREEEREPESDERLDELQGKKEALYTAIKELHSDYELGNLSPQDHQELEEKYKRKAAVVLQDIDSRSKGRKVEDEIEREILRWRGKDKIEEEILRFRQKLEVAGLVCSRCGGKNATSAKFCAHCGAALGVRCPQCGASYNSQNRFCSQCGAKLISSGESTSEAK